MWQCNLCGTGTGQKYHRAVNRARHKLSFNHQVLLERRQSEATHPDEPVAEAVLAGVRGPQDVAHSALRSLLESMIPGRPTHPSNDPEPPTPSPPSSNVPLPEINWGLFVLESDTELGGSADQAAIGSIAQSLQKWLDEDGLSTTSEEEPEERADEDIESEPDVPEPTVSGTCYTCT